MRVCVCVCVFHLLHPWLSGALVMHCFLVSLFSDTESSCEISLHSGHRQKNVVDDLEKTFLEAIVSGPAAVQAEIGCIRLASKGISGSVPRS